MPTTGDPTAVMPATQIRDHLGHRAPHHALVTIRGTRDGVVQLSVHRDGADHDSVTVELTIDQAARLHALLGLVTGYTPADPGVTEPGHLDRLEAARLLLDIGGLRREAAGDILATSLAKARRSLPPLPRPAGGGTREEAANIADAAAERYYTDPQFHARVREAVQIAEMGARPVAGDMLSRPELLVAASIALYQVEGPR